MYHGNKIVDCVKKNQMFIWTFLLCFFIMVVCSLNEINFFQIITKYIFNSDYRENFFINSDMQVVANDVPHNIFGLVQYLFRTGMFEFDYLIVTATGIFQILIPFFPIFGGIAFYRTYNSIYKCSLIKTTSYKKQIYKDLLWGACKLACALFGAYLCLFLIVNLSGAAMPDSQNIARAREFLLDWLSIDFYFQNTKLYFLIEGFFRFFYIPFIYTMFAQAAVLLFVNVRDIFLVNIAYYFGLSAIGYALALLIPNFAFYLNPSAFMASGTYVNINSLLFIGINSIPLILAIVAIEWGCRHVEI